LATWKEREEKTPRKCRDFNQKEGALPLLARQKKIHERTTEKGLLAATKRKPLKGEIPVKGKAGGGERWGG